MCDTPLPALYAKASILTKQTSWMVLETDSKLGWDSRTVHGAIRYGRRGESSCQSALPGIPGQMAHGLPSAQLAGALSNERSRGPIGWANRTNRAIPDLCLAMPRTWVSSACLPTTAQPRLGLLQLGAQMVGKGQGGELVRMGFAASQPRCSVLVFGPILTPKS